MFRFVLITLLLVLLWCAPERVFGSSQDTLKNSLVGYPIGFYSPETRIGVGLAGAYNFRFKKSDTKSPPSQLQLGLAYTQNKQLLLSLPFDFYFQERKHQISGEFGFYQYLYFYYGTRLFQQNFRETYQVDFPRFRIQYTRKIRGNFYAGAKYWWEDYRNPRLSDEGNLIEGKVPGSRSWGATGGLGGFVLLDTRDNVYATKTGYFIELFGMLHDPLTGSDYKVQRWRFDTRWFIPLNKTSHFAFQFFGDFLQGDVPFFLMTGAGSSKRMRGYVEGRYRDHQMIMLQSEWRCFPLQRWGFALFGSFASVENTLVQHQLNRLIPAAGVGLRYIFDPEKRIHLRLDFARGINSNALYFTIGESF